MIPPYHAIKIMMNDLWELGQTAEKFGVRSKQLQIAKNKFKYSTAKLRRIIHAQQVHDRKIARKNRKRGRNG